MAEYPVFKPENRKPPSVTKFVRLTPDDLARVETIAERIGESSSEIIRQAVHFALEHMTDG